MSVIHTRPYEITRFSDICDIIYSFNESHPHAHSHIHSLTHPHTIHTTRTVNGTHPITRSTMLSFVDAQKHTITLYNINMFSCVSFTQGLMKWLNSVIYAIQSIHSISYTLMLAHILIHLLTLTKIRNQQPLTSPINTATRSMSHILNHLLIHKSFCNALIHSLCTLQSTHPPIQTIINSHCKPSHSFNHWLTKTPIHRLI